MVDRLQGSSNYKKIYCRNKGGFIYEEKVSSCFASPDDGLRLLSGSVGGR